VVQREAGLHLANLHLLPAYQSRGLGTAIIRDLQARATAAGLPLTTQALKVNPACAFYQRLGFRIMGDTGIRYRLIWEG
jgi:ribosomal protein S18 acetylase RimI-like enzyme